MARKQDVATIPQGDLLPPDAEAFCTEQAQVIRLLGRRVVGDVIEIGKRLIAVREKRGHGHWLSWLKSEFGWDIRTAQRYIQTGEAFGKYDTVTHLDAWDIDARALYALSAPAVPEEVREQAVQKAEAGERITKAAAEKMVADARKAEADRFAEVIDQHKREVAAEAEEAVQEAMQELAGNAEALKARIAEIEAAAKKKPDLTALEKIIVAMPKFKGKALTGDQWRLVAQLLDQTIGVGNKTYQPLPKEEILQNEENLRVSGLISQALETLAAAPPSAALIAAALPVQLSHHRRVIAAAIEWCGAYRAALESSGK